MDVDMEAPVCTHTVAVSGCRYGRALHILSYEAPCFTTYLHLYYGSSVLIRITGGTCRTYARMCVASSACVCAPARACLRKVSRSIKSFRWVRYICIYTSADPSLTDRF